MKLYKVVSRYDGRMWSLHNAWEGAVEYKRGETTVPVEGAGPLTAFRTKGLALYYANPVGFGFSYQGNLVIEVDASPSTETAAWYQGEFGERRTHVEDLPRGVVLCDSITVLDIIDPWWMLRVDRGREEELGSFFIQGFGVLCHDVEKFWDRPKYWYEDWFSRFLRFCSPQDLIDQLPEIQHAVAYQSLWSEEGLEPKVQKFRQIIRALGKEG